MEIQELGLRIKRVRKALGMTLKEVEAASKVSATHVSEIERGKTSPTVGALSRIAMALGKDTSFFLEARNLSEVSRIRFEERERVEFATAEGFYQPLTLGIPGGHLRIYKVHLEGEAPLSFDERPSSGEVTLICERGRLQFMSEEDEFNIAEGDSLHFTEAHRYKLKCVGASTADFILVGTRRHLVAGL